MKNPHVTKIVAQSAGFTELVGSCVTPVYPGMAVIGYPNEAAVTFPVEGAGLEPLQIVTQDEMFGQGPSIAIAAGDNLTVIRPQKNDRIWLRIASGVTVAKKDYLKPDGSGCFTLLDSNDTVANVSARAETELDANDTVRLVLCTIF